jgi:hypothetical protein
MAGPLQEEHQRSVQGGMQEHAERHWRSQLEAGLHDSFWTGHSWLVLMEAPAAELLSSAPRSFVGNS